MPRVTRPFVRAKSFDRTAPWPHLGSRTPPTPALSREREDFLMTFECSPLGDSFQRGNKFTLFYRMGEGRGGFVLLPHSYGLILKTIDRLQPGVEQAIGIAVFGWSEAGGFPTAERQSDIHAGSGRVQFQDAGLGALQELLLQFG